MVKMIRETFAERVRRSSKLKRLTEDLEKISNLKVHFFGVGDKEVFLPPCYAHSPICRTLNEKSRGAKLCTRVRNRLLEEATHQTVVAPCVAGTRFLAVPVTSSVGLLGHLVVAGFYSSPLTLLEVNRIRHLLEREGFRIAPGDVTRLGEKTRVVELSREESLRRILEMAAGFLVKELSLELFADGGDLPEPLRKACAYIREHFQDDPTVEEVARVAGYSTSHFSRLFHARTGLRFKEYLIEVRLQEVRRRLRETPDPITQIALDAGFGTLSQFNRQFLAHYRISPREYRRKYH